MDLFDEYTDDDRQEIVEVISNLGFFSNVYSDLEITAEQVNQIIKAGETKEGCIAQLHKLQKKNCKTTSIRALLAYILAIDGYEHDEPVDLGATPIVEPDTPKGLKHQKRGVSFIMSQTDDEQNTHHTPEFSVRHIRRESSHKVIAPGPLLQKTEKSKQFLELARQSMEVHSQEEDAAITLLAQPITVTKISSNFVLGKRLVKVSDDGTKIYWEKTWMNKLKSKWKFARPSKQYLACVTNVLYGNCHAFGKWSSPKGVYTMYRNNICPWLCLSLVFGETAETLDFCFDSENSIKEWFLAVQRVVPLGSGQLSPSEFDRMNSLLKERWKEECHQMRQQDDSSGNNNNT